MYEQPPSPARQRIPKDGPGPRGVPDCYYTSRVLNSTFRYVRFVKRLRQEEEDTRKGKENALKELKDKQRNDFFIRCDRRALINDVARRVDLCMESYQIDLENKRHRLKELLNLEEEHNIRKFVEQAQYGSELVWQEKQNRLKYLLEKRKKELEEKYKDTPLSKCVHVLPCILKLQEKETQEILLYQIKEKEARKMAEKEFDIMWYEVAMKESEALAARMEQDAIERLRRDLECKQYTDYQLEQRRIKREKERERLKEEAKWFRSMWEEDNRKEDEAERIRTEKRMKTAEERKQSIIERQQKLEKKKQDDAVIQKTWDSLANQGAADEVAKEELRKRKERELVECNRHLVQLKQELELYRNNNSDLIEEEGRKRQEATDKRRCAYKTWSRKTNQECRQGMIEQMKERKKAQEDLQKKIDEEDKYAADLYNQLQELVKYKEMSEAAERKRRQKQILEQIEYNKLLKERAQKEAEEQIQKGKLAAKEYQQEIAKMLSRPFFSDEIHPFMKPMARGLHLQEKCPCSKKTYCK